MRSVLNAGSSSLKFCVYGRAPAADWRMRARGQVEGIGTLPRFVAKGEDGLKLVDELLPDSVRRCPRRARIARRVAQRPLRPLARGRRRPSRRPRRPAVRGAGRDHAAGVEGVARADPAGAAPSALQPRGHRGGGGAAAGRAAGRLFRHQLPSRAAARRGTGAPPVGDPEGRRAALRVPRPVLRIHRVRAAARRAGDRRRPRDRRAPWQRREHVRPEERPQHRPHARLHRARRTVHGHASRRARPGRGPLPVPEPRDVRARGRDAALQEVGTARPLRDQQRHARPDRTRRPLGATGGRLFRVSRRPGDRRTRRGARRRRRHRVHGGHWRELAGSPPPHLRGLGLARDRCGSRARTRRTVHASRARRPGSPPGSSRPTKS